MWKRKKKKLFIVQIVNVKTTESKIVRYTADCDMNYFTFFFFLRTLKYRNY